MRKPNFVIPGAGRSGTTALVGYLKQHPEVFIPHQKEPNYFCKKYDLGVDWYLGLFYREYREKGVMESFVYDLLYNYWSGEKAVGEASTAYLNCEGCPRRMHEFNPDFKLIFLLRNPIERAFSNYKKEIQVLGVEKPFGEMVKEKDERASKYLQYGLYYRNINNFLDFFSKKQMLFVLFEDFVEEPEDELQRIFEFLDLEADFALDTSKIDKNPSRMPISLRLQRLISTELRAEVDEWFFKRAFLYLARSLLNPLNHLLEIREPPEIGKETKKELVEYFRDDIVKLESFLGRDLSHWI